MTLIFQHLSLWPWLALIIAPLLIHLFARAHPPVYRFSSLEFILHIARRTRRIRRPQEWLLWLLRTAACAALIMLFLRPLLFTHKAFADPRAARNVMLVVDASASMAYVDGAQSRFSAACAAAADILGDLGANDTANVIWMRTEPEPVFPSAGINLPYLRDILRRARVSNEAADVLSALNRAAILLSGLPGRKEICVISDFQKSNWETVHFKPPADISLMAVKVGLGDGDNQALTHLACQPVQPLAGEKVTLFGEVRNFSPLPRKVAVFLEFGELRDRQELNLEAWGRATATFTFSCDTAGNWPMTLRLGEDAFPGDNTRRLILPVRANLPVGILANEPETAGYWHRALKTIPWANISQLSSNHWPAADSDEALLLSGWNGTGWEVVRERLRAGRTVIWYPAPGSLLEILQRLTVDNPVTPIPGTMTWETARDPHRLVNTAPEDACFAVFNRGEYGDPAAGVFYGRLRPALPPAREAVTLLEYEDHVPALVRYRLPGALYLWNLPLQPAYSDWASRPEFLPLLAELLLNGRPIEAGAADRDVFYPGQRLLRSCDRGVPMTAVRVTDEQGREQTAERRETDRDSCLVTGPVTEPGLYTWKMGEEILGQSIVNFPVVESDLRGGDARELASDAPVVKSGREARQIQAGLNLWPWFLGLAGLMLVLEMLVRGRAAKT